LPEQGARAETDERAQESNESDRPTTPAAPDRQHEIERPAMAGTETEGGGEVALTLQPGQACNAARLRAVNVSIAVQMRMQHLKTGFQGLRAELEELKGRVARLERQGEEGRGPTLGTRAITMTRATTKRIQYPHERQRMREEGDGSAEE
jgi:hypothetical protein